MIIDCRRGRHRRRCHTHTHTKATEEKSRAFHQHHHRHQKALLKVTFIRYDAINDTNTPAQFITFYM